MKEAGEGFDAAGRSYVCLRLEGRGDKVKIPPAALARYDDNIAQHVRAMNARRPEPVTLRYFQHLAVLYSEIFLDWYFHRRGEMLRALNRFVDQRNCTHRSIHSSLMTSLGTAVLTAGTRRLIGPLARGPGAASRAMNSSLVT